MLYKFAKRSFDIIFSILLAILFIPLWIIVPIAIRVDSRGRVIYTQKRVGLASRYFTIYKFRSMKEGTPDIPTDRVTDQEMLNTRVGTFLRRFSIDEIPQLVNILKGDMSFVGPRPALYNQYYLIALRIEKGVDMIRPGVTGLAQVNGRDALTIEQKVDYDFKYLKTATFSLDLKILFMTTRAALNGQGAN
jgi:O-antigen biosynthesis protein WbqP